jgi:hypothetical protein
MGKPPCQELLLCLLFIPTDSDWKFKRNVIIYFDRASSFPFFFFSKMKIEYKFSWKGRSIDDNSWKKNTVSLRGEGGPCHPEINDILTIWSNMFVRFAFIHLLFEWSFFLSQILCAHLLPLISWHFGRAHHDCTLGHLYCPKEEEEEGAPNFCSILRALSGKMSWTLGKGWNPFAYIIGHTLRLVFS